MQEDDLTKQSIIESFKMLESQNQQLKAQANHFLMNIVTREEAWMLAKELVVQANDDKWKFLGAQILYLKIVRSALELNVNGRQQLKEFVFGQLNNPQTLFPPLIDKLASSGAYLGSIMSLEEWPTFIIDLIQFMKQSQSHLKNGLYVLERVPEELRSTNKISFGLKKKIINEFLKQEEKIVLVFNEVIGLQNVQLLKINLRGMESWTKSGFPILKYTELTKKVLMLSLVYHIDIFEMSIGVILQSIKSATLNKIESLVEVEPQQQLKGFVGSQIESIKLIIQYIFEKRDTFLGPKMEYEQKHIYLQMVKETLLQFSFLLLEDIAFQLLQIILLITSNSDLRLSKSSFQFWIDFSEKVTKIKLPMEVQERIWKAYEQLFETVNRKVIVQNEYLLDDPDLKEDATIDDFSAMTFSEYRKESTTLYKFIYDYFLTISKTPSYYFQKLSLLIEADSGIPHKHTQLALFCLKSAIQSMISTEDALYIRKIIEIILQKGSSMPARVSGQLMNVLRDCTKQIREDQNLFMRCLKFSLAFIDDDKLCHHSAYCFQILMEAIGIIKEPEIVVNLIQFYQSKTFPKETIVQQILQGIISAIVKLQVKQQVYECIKKLLEKMYKRINVNKNGEGYLLSLLQMKVILNSYEVGEKSFKESFHEFFREIGGQGLKMIEVVLPYCIDTGLKVLSFNELGLSCSIYRNVLKICGSSINEKYLRVLQLSLSVLSQQSIVEKYTLVNLLSETLTTFSGSSVESMNQWLIEKIPSLYTYFFSTFRNIQLLDPDIIKWFYAMQQGIMLYNPHIFLSFQSKHSVIEMGLYALRHINEKNMQRKVVNFIFLCCQQEKQEIVKWHVKIIQTVFSSIPIINSMCYHVISRILINLLNTVSTRSEIIEKLLQISPYQEFPHILAQIFKNAVLLVVENRHERYLKNIFEDLGEYARNPVNQHTFGQLQIKYSFWRRELKKK